MLLVPAVYWDDWVFYKVPAATILQTFQEAGAIFNWTGYLHLLMQKAGPWIYRIAVFFLMFGAGICLERILAKHPQVPDSIRLLIVIFFLTLPFNMARAAMVTLPYSLCYFMFFLAWMLIPSQKLISGVLFLASFNTNSLLVFYVLPIVDSAIRNDAFRGLGNAWKFIIKYGLFLCLPFIFWMVKQVWFKPTGWYANYNQNFNVANIDDASKAQFLDLSSVRIEPVLFLVALAIVLTLLRGLDIPRTNFGLSSKLLGGGIIALTAACFPYWILGLVPGFSDWDSRHQLLMPLGAAMLVTGTLTALPNQIARWMAVALVAASTSISVDSYLALHRDWDKQKQIMTLLSQSSEVKAADIVIFQDNTAELNALDRKYRFYEWNGLMSEAFGDERRLGLSPVEFEKFRVGQFAKYWNAGSMYRCGEFKGKEARNIVSVIVERNRNNVDNTNIVNEGKAIRVEISTPKLLY
jgi:hypothetical protein